MEPAASTNNILSDQDILDAFLKAQEEAPDNGRNELLVKIKSAWNISNKYLKKVVDPDRAAKAPIFQARTALPSDALAA